MSRAGLSTEVVTVAAADLADRVGLDQVRLSELARHLGVRLPSLYSHVAGADDLHARVTLLALEELADRGERALAGLEGAAALGALGEMHRRYAAEHPGRYEAAARLRLPPSPEVTRVAGRVGALTDAVLRGYDLTDEDRVHAIRLVGSVVRGFLALEAGGAFDHSTPPSEVSWGRALDGLDALLRSWSR